LSVARPRKHDGKIMRPEIFSRVLPSQIAFHRAQATNARRASQARRSSDFDKKFTNREKSLCAKFRADTLALVTPKDRNSSCEQLVNRSMSPSARRHTLPANSGAPCHGRRANRTAVRTAMLSNHFQLFTEAFYAPTCLPKLVSPDHACPTAPL
jgi:hypothetical protein